MSGRKEQQTERSARICSSVQKGKWGKKGGGTQPHTDTRTHTHTHSGGYLEWQIETGREVRERGTACDQWSSPKRGLVTNNQVN